MTGLYQERALIAGASRGLGRALAPWFAAGGVTHLALLALDAAALEQLRDQICFSSPAGRCSSSRRTWAGMRTWDRSST
jgi:short-subunit dehydrogenase